MEINNLWKHIPNFWQKYKYVALVMLIGLFLMLLPEKQAPALKNQTDAEITAPPEETDESRLANILEQIEGAGKVSVMLSVEKGSEVLYQTNDDISTREDSTSTRIETVIVSTSDRSEAGLIRQSNPPTYLGAVIVCQGGNNPVVRLAIVEAVSKITGLGSDRISVVKMK